MKGIAAAVLACVLLGACSGDSSPSPTPSPAATATPTAEPSATGSSGAAIDLPPNLAASATGIWLRRDGLRAGDEIPDVLGAFVFDTRAGTGTLWSLDPSAGAGPDFVLVDTTPNADFVTATGYTANTYIVNTATGQSFIWGPERTTADGR